jgi:hypothetical protein
MRGDCRELRAAMVGGNVCRSVPARIHDNKSRQAKYASIHW